MRAVLMIAAVALAVCGAAFARDHGQYGPAPAGSPDKAWWNSLHAGGNSVPCCDIADGQKVEDVDWDTINVASANKDPVIRYRVRLNGKWIVVPPEAVVTVPNRFGSAVVWPYTFGDETAVRCFMPGSGA